MSHHGFDVACPRDTLTSGDPAVSDDPQALADAGAHSWSSTSSALPARACVVSGIGQSFAEMVAAGTMPQSVVRDLAFGSPGQQLTAYLTARLTIGLRDVARAVLR
jgi:hypothetical protein